MKHSKVVLLVFIIAILMSPGVFAMGGPPQEEGQENVPKGAMGEAISPEKASALELEKAWIELPLLEAWCQKADKYLDVLSKKITIATIAGDTKKADELKVVENQITDDENKIKTRIEIIKSKYPDLPVATLEASEQAAQPVTSEAETSGTKIPGSNIIYHEVQMGDTLVSISRKYFDSPDYYLEIAKMNDIKDVRYISQGTILKIDLGLKKSGIPSAAAAETANESEIVYHIVAAGDTLMSISREYFDGSASYYREIAEMNGLAGYDLKIGMRLKIDKSLKKAPQPKL